MTFILPTYPSPLRNRANDFQVNSLKVNCQEIKPASDQKFYDFWIEICREFVENKNFLVIDAEMGLFQTTHPPETRYVSVRPEDNDRGLKGPHLDRLSSRLLVWCTRTLAAEEFRVCLPYIR